MKIGIIINDLRQNVIAYTLEKKHYAVKRILTQCDLLACSDVDVLIFPIKGPDEQGILVINKDEVLDFKTFIALAKKDLLIFCGLRNKGIDAWNFTVIYLLEFEDVTDANALLTAQGVLAYVLNNINKGLRETSFDVIGYGHCGKYIMEFLQGLQVNVRLVSSKEKALKTTNKFSDVVVYAKYNELTEVSDVIINTAPMLMINETMMKKWSNKPLILDVASAPGGVDYNTAKELGIKAILLPSLPPIYTPISAGLILSEKIDKELRNE